MLDQKAGDDPVDDLQHEREQFGMGGEEDAQRDRKRQHPLTHRHLGDNVIDQVSGRVSGTDLMNPDFAAYARAFGAQGEVVETTTDFAPAFERAASAGKPALVEVRIHPEALTPRMSLSEIRAQALKTHEG